MKDSYQFEHHASVIVCLRVRQKTEDDGIIRFRKAGYSPSDFAEGKRTEFYERDQSRPRLSSRDDGIRSREGHL